MGLEFIDTHAHLDFEYEKDETIKDIIKRATDNKVTKIITISSDVNSIEKASNISKEFDNIYHSIGLHPHEAKDYNAGVEEKILNNHNSKCVAVGEIGLDYHYELSPIDTQKKVFIRMTEIARELNLPAIIHSREADKDTYEILKSEYKDICNAVLHCYSGTKEELKKYLDLGMYISFTGIITFPKAQTVKEALAYAPIDRIMIETDCPFLAPVPHRGKKNYPEYIPIIANKMAEIKIQSIEKIAEFTTNNAKNLFNIK